MAQPARRRPNSPLGRASLLVIVVGILVASACSQTPRSSSEQAAGPVLLVAGGRPPLTTAPPPTEAPAVSSQTGSTFTATTTTTAATATTATTPIQPSEITGVFEPSTTVLPQTLLRLTGEPAVLIIGDSVLKNLEIAKTWFPFPVRFDTSVSRSTAALPEILAAQRELGPLPPYVVIHLGTNGWAESYVEVFESQLAELANHHVILMNVYADRVWQNPANSALVAMTERHGHVSLVDWRSTATLEMLRSDEVHPNECGRVTLRDMVRDEVYRRAAVVHGEAFRIETPGHPYGSYVAPVC